MPDFSAGSIVLQYNTNTNNTTQDTTPTWTGTGIQFGGGSGANEIRFAPNSGATTTTSSANWPYVTRPASGTTTVPQLWAFTADTTGLQVSTYTGDNTKANVLRWSWDNTGTFASAPQFGAFANSTHTAPAAGTQPPGTNNDAITNGSSDTSNTSYLKAACYGAFSATIAAGAIGANPASTTGTAGPVTPSSGAWSVWQSLQGFTQYLQAFAIPAATTAGTWNWSCVLFIGQTMTTGVITPVVTMQYSYS